jgi:hypothetical protein
MKHQCVADMTVMPLLNEHLTDIAVDHIQSAAGMAHFAGSGPKGKVCGDCSFWGYSKVSKKEMTNKQTGEVYQPTRAHEGCKKFFLLTERHGPKISPYLLACKYFEGK